MSSLPDDHWQGQYEIIGCGRRRRWSVAVLDPSGAYPDQRFDHPEALYRASGSLVYTVAPSEPPNEYGFSEIAWANVGEIRLWGAIALAIEEGKGFYTMCPLLHEDSRGSFWGENLNREAADRFAQRLAMRLPEQSYELHWIKPEAAEVCALYEELRRADNLLLRGVSCYLKSLILWKYPLFIEEMGVNLYLALEAGLSVLRRRLSTDQGDLVSFEAVFQFIEGMFHYGEALVGFWKECREDRNRILHPDSHSGAYVIQPMSVDDIWELLDPMLTLYRYILIGKPRPTTLAG